jgi:DNA-binding XRE family transcriptional regulator
MIESERIATMPVPQAVEQGRTRVPAPTSYVTLPHLRAWRVHKLWTQAQLASESHISAPTIVRAERGAPVGALTAERLARALGVTVEQLQSEKPS